MNRFFKLLKRWFKQISAIVLITVGIITFPLPIPIGAILITIGLALLITTNKSVARWIKDKRIKTPRLNNRFIWMENKLPQFFSKAIRKTAPDYGRKKRHNTDLEGSTKHQSSDVSVAQKRQP